jgi:hypothetical protein
MRGKRLERGRNSIADTLKLCHDYSDLLNADRLDVDHVIVRNVKSGAKDWKWQIIYH